MSDESVEPGQTWIHETQGRCVVVKRDRPTMSDDDPWEMRRESDGAQLFMWRGARESDAWKRVRPS